MTYQPEKRKGKNVEDLDKINEYDLIFIEHHTANFKGLKPQFMFSDCFEITL